MDIIIIYFLQKKSIKKIEEEFVELELILVSLTHIVGITTLSSYEATSRSRINYFSISQCIPYPELLMPRLRLRKNWRQPLVGSGSGTRSRRRSGLGVLFGPNTFNSCVQMIIRINIITWESNSVKLTNTSSLNVLSSKMVTPAYDYIVSTRPFRGRYANLSKSNHA